MHLLPPLPRQAIKKSKVIKSKYKIGNMIVAYNKKVYWEISWRNRHDGKLAHFCSNCLSYKISVQTSKLKSKKLSLWCMFSTDNVE